MSNNRHDFSVDTVRKLSDRVGAECSNPDCRAATRGPHSDDVRALNIGSASHIHAASAGGPRYDPEQSEDERRSIHNGVWLCRNCGTLIDSDVERFPAPLLREWKAHAELRAYERLGRPAQIAAAPSDASYMTTQAAELLRHLADEYVKAGYPNPKVWMFTPDKDALLPSAELRALGLLYFYGPRGGAWRLTEQGVGWIMRNRRL